MKKKYGIGLILAAALCICALSFAYRAEHEYLKQKAELAKLREQKLEKEKELASRVAETEGVAGKKEGYCLKIVNDYVVIYLADGTTFYDYTSIHASNLPDEVKGKLEKGYHVENEKALYAFLESYSS